jgi:acyl-CoA synthetase (AMP-forming)/AMP-acid ligase II
VLVASSTGSCTVTEVDLLARAAGEALAPLDLAPGSVLGCAAPNGPGFLALLLAARRAGLVAMLLDDGIKEDEVERLGARFGVAGVLRSRGAWPRSAADFVVQIPPGSRERPPLPELAAVVLVTSASTGEPRAVATSMEALFADFEALSRAMGIRAEDRAVAAVPFPHAYGLSTLVFPALATGRPLLLPDGVGPFRSLAAAAAGGGTVLPTVPAYLTALVQVAEPAPLPRSLRLILSAGAPLAAETAVRVRERYGRSVHVLYGSTECGGITYDAEGSAAERGCVGQPVPGVTVQLEPLPDARDGAGRVVVSSASVALSYLPSDPERLSGGRFVTDDLATFCDGELRLVGRLSNRINVKGRKVDPHEVESVIAELQGVTEVHVLGLSKPNSGDQVVAAVVACPARSLTVERVSAWCRERLNDFKVPRSIYLVDELPRSPRGKIDTAALRRTVTGEHPHD